MRSCMDAKEITLSSRALFLLVLSKHSTFGPILQSKIFALDNAIHGFWPKDNAGPSLPCKGDHRSSLLVPIPRHNVSGRIPTCLAR